MTEAHRPQVEVVIAILTYNQRDKTLACLASLAHVVRTPFACLSVSPVTNQFLVINVAIDNLLKGAASQAVQNFNLMFGFEETTALFTDDMVANEKN